MRLSRRTLCICTLNDILHDTSSVCQQRINFTKQRKKEVLEGYKPSLCNYQHATRVKPGKIHNDLYSAITISPSLKLHLTTNKANATNFSFAKITAVKSYLPIYEQSEQIFSVKTITKPPEQMCYWQIACAIAL